MGVTALHFDQVTEQFHPHDRVNVVQHLKEAYSNMTVFSAETGTITLNSCDVKNGLSVYNVKASAPIN